MYYHKNIKSIKLIVKDYFRKNSSEIDYKKVASDLLNDVKGDYGINQNRYENLVKLIDKYNLNKEYLKVDFAVEKFYAKEYKINSKTLKEKYVVNDTICYLMFYYLNYKYKKSFNFEIVVAFQKDPLSRFEYLNIDYDIITKKENMTLEEIGNEKNITKERVRQIYNQMIEKLSSEKIPFDYPYIFSEELLLTPKYKQVIVISQKDKLYNKDFDMYVFMYAISTVLKTIKYSFDILVEKNDKLINNFFCEYEQFIIRYIKKHDNFYIVNNKVYTNNRFYTKKRSNYILNYMDEFKLSRLNINEEFINKFLNSIHGQLYQEESKVKSNPRNIRVNLERENELIPLGGNEFLYDLDFDFKAKCIKEYLKEIVSNNLPIKGKEKINKLFKDELYLFDINDDNIYFIVKEILKDEYQFKKYKIYPLNYKITEQVEQIHDNLIKYGKSKISNNNLSYIRDKLNLDMDKLIYTKGTMYYVKQGHFQDYDKIKDIKVKESFPGIVLKKDVIAHAPKEIKANYDDKSIYKIWCKINDYNETVYFGTKDSTIDSIEKLINVHYKIDHKIKYNELFVILNNLIDSKNISSLIYYFEQKGIIKRDGNEFELILI